MLFRNVVVRQVLGASIGYEGKIKVESYKDSTIMWNSRLDA